MSRPIKLTQEDIESIKKDFASTLVSARVADGKISYTKILTTVNRKATLYFTEVAWSKMWALIREFSTEVGWHGVAKRGDDPEKDEYYIIDILPPYPQTVTGATVNTDQQKYTMWLYSDENDEVFNDIRFHGHSHVNMGTTPSGVDTTHWDGILEQLTDDMFYIFAIWNKRGDKTIKIYDFRKNVLFDTSDVTVKVLEEEDGLSAFLKIAKERVEEKKYTYTPPKGYEGYGGMYSSLSNTSSNTNTITAKKDDKAEKKSDKEKSDKKKKRKGKRVDRPSQMTIFDDRLGGW